MRMFSKIFTITAAILQNAVRNRQIKRYYSTDFAIESPLNIDISVFICTAIHVISGFVRLENSGIVQIRANTRNLRVFIQR